MNQGWAALSAEATRLAVELPADRIERLAELLVGYEGQDWERVRQQALSISPQPRFQALIEALLSAWRRYAAHVSAEGVALALCAAAATARHYRDEQSTSLVWTGPGVLRAEAPKGTSKNDDACVPTWRSASRRPAPSPLLSSMKVMICERLPAWVICS